MKLDDIKKLQQKKYRSQFGFYLVEGEHLILELQKAMATQLSASAIALYVTEDHQQWANQLGQQFTVNVVSQKQMAAISNTKSPQGIVACVPLPSTKQYSPALADERCIYLHEVQDPGNLGTILRTLAWFGGFRLLLSPNSVDPHNPKVVRASMGAIFHTPIEQEVTLNHLTQRFDKLAYLDLHGSKISTADFAGYSCYLFGNEARGVPSEAISTSNADAFTIPGNGSLESLNLASAVSMCAYQLAVN